MLFFETISRCNSVQAFFERSKALYSIFGISPKWLLYKYMTEGDSKRNEPRTLFTEKVGANFAQGSLARS